MHVTVLSHYLAFIFMICPPSNYPAPHNYMLTCPSAHMLFEGAILPLLTSSLHKHLGDVTNTRDPHLPHWKLTLSLGGHLSVSGLGGCWEGFFHSWMLLASKLPQRKLRTSTCPCPFPTCKVVNSWGRQCLLTWASPTVPACHSHRQCLAQIAKSLITMSQPA